MAAEKVQLPRLKPAPLNINDTGVAEEAMELMNHLWRFRGRVKKLAVPVVINIISISISELPVVITIITVNNSKLPALIASNKCQWDLRSPMSNLSVTKISTGGWKLTTSVHKPIP
ncbi:hypothetical protein BT96DRAFT_951069 [Gymnopus androsaceus JB14]|uniref:Uncharacterized protein n=1 Tax=Gymnopus androsaceus JB14 TaxID=1447944 RepID=A0A6A4GEH0_9AGAR|nr:hypothetical protein BT96DRAFT_951069 [Gymnopus androsaceus JB14]